MKRLPDNIWKSPVIQQRLIQEACFECERGGISEKKHFWCLVPFADSGTGVQVLRNYDESDLKNCDPHEMQIEFARRIMTGLQHEAHHDGLWLVGYTHPPTAYGVITDTENCWNRLIAIWHDSDGDPQYTLESDIPFLEQVQAGEIYYINLAQQAHASWSEMYGTRAIKDDFGIHASQSTKAALEALK